MPSWCHIYFPVSGCSTVSLWLKKLPVSYKQEMKISCYALRHNDVISWHFKLYVFTIMSTFVLELMKRVVGKKHSREVYAILSFDSN